MPSLYDIDSRFNNLMEIAELGEIDDETIAAALAEIDSEFKDKLLNISKYIKHLEATTSGLKQEEERLSKKRKGYERVISLLKNNIYNSMKLKQMIKVEAGTFTLSIKRNPASVIITNEDIVPMEYKTIQAVEKIDKIALKEAMKSGAEIAGARLEQKETLNIK